MIRRVICAGLGGQGVLTAGKLLMYAAYDKDLSVTWFPSYGNEMRGGNANCNVIISDKKIATPYADHPDILIAMSTSAVDIYEESMAPGGTLYVNSSMVDPDRKYRDDIKVVKVPATDLAIELKSERNANLCMLGSVIKDSELFSLKEFEDSMCSYFEKQGKGRFNEGNCKCVEAGYNL